MEKVVVGLGNPGVSYRYHRHNLGRSLVEQYLLKKNFTPSFSKKFNALYFFDQSRKVHFLLPESYMNLSGQSVAPLIHYFKIEIVNILIIHDELDLPFAKLLFKKGGGSAGHNGLKSIMESLGSNDFIRLRLGIGKNPFKGSREQNISWVLSNFSQEEFEQIEKLYERSPLLIDSFVEKDFANCSSLFNNTSFAGERYVS